VGEPGDAIRSEYEPHEGYLLVRTSGKPEVESLAQSSAQALERARALGVRRILVDARGLTGLLGTMDRFQLGIYFALHWDLSVRVAMVFSPETLEERKFLENVARNRAVPTQFFSDTQEALAWLGAAPENPAPVESANPEGRE